MINPFDLSQLVFCSTTGGVQSCVLDKSVEMLGNIFGTVATQSISMHPGVTPDQIPNFPTSVALFSLMIGYFNLASMGIVTLIFTYILITGTINTAHEGTPFGRQSHTTFLLIRSILGPVLMFPLPYQGSGLAFSALQSVMMHFVLIGVNLANAVWGQTMTTALAVPPTQLPGPVNGLVATQAAKLFLYQSAYNVMGLNPNAPLTGGLDVPGPQIIVGQTTENALQDSQVYSYILTSLANDCTTNARADDNNGNDPAATAIAKSLCTAAVNKMATNQWPGVVYPLSAGRDLNGTNPTSSSLFYNTSSGGGSNAYTGPTYVQFQFAFGNNAPYYNNGQVAVSPMTYTVSPITNAIQGPPNSLPNSPTSCNPFGAGAPDACGTNPSSANASAGSVLNDVLQTMTGPNGNPKLFVGATSISNLQPPQPNGHLLIPSSVVCTPAGGTGGSPCDMSNSINYMTNTLLNQAQAIAAQEQAEGLIQTTVPGTGTTCVLDPTIPAAITGNGNAVIGGNGAADANNNATVTGNFGTEPGTTNTDIAQCVRKEITGFSATTPNGTTTYVLIPGQDYSKSWWYGSEVYLTINAQLAQNIKNIAKMVQQFSISDNSLQFSVNATAGNSAADCTAMLTPGTSQPNTLPTKCVYYRALQKSRNNWGHNVDDIIDLSNSANIGIDSLSTEYNNMPLTYGPSGTGATFSSAAFQPPSWAQTICIFDPLAPSFLDAQASTGPGNINTNTCFDQNNGMGQYVVQPTSALAIAIPNQAGFIDSNTNTSLFDELQSMPQDYQMPVQLMILWEVEDNLQHYQTNELQVDSMQALAVNIENILAVLKLNHVYPGSTTAANSGDVGVNTSTEIDPAQSLLMEMFSKILGKNQVGSMAGDLSQNMTGVMQDVYNLGNQEIVAAPGSGQAGAMNAVIANSYNNIANAQQVGIEMINLVVFAVQEVYAQIENTANSDLAQDNKWSRTMEILAGTGQGAGGIAAAVDPAVGTYINSGVQVSEAALAIVLQNHLVQQSYTLGSMIMWLPLIVTTCISLFTAGISFALIVPIMPFILYWAGQISWLLSVMEAMVAAPLLCLAWAAPGGHQHWGNTLTGVRILIGIVFRPVLMVIGLFAALILTFVLIQFSSQAFQIVSSQVLSFAASFTSTPPVFWAGTTTVYTDPVSITEGILAVLMLLLYCSIMVMAFTKCYSTIYAIPEHVLKWIGVDASSGSAQDMEKLTGGVTQNAGQAGQAAGSTMTQGAQTQSSHMSQGGQADQSNASSAMRAGDAGMASGNATYKKMNPKTAGPGGGSSDSGGDTPTPPAA